VGERPLVERWVAGSPSYDSD